MNEILLYKTPNNDVRLEVFIRDEKVVISKMEITTFSNFDKEKPEL